MFLHEHIGNATVCQRAVSRILGNQSGNKREIPSSMAFMMRYWGVMIRAEIVDCEITNIPLTLLNHLSSPFLLSFLRHVYTGRSRRHNKRSLRMCSIKAS